MKQSAALGGFAGLGGWSGLLGRAPAVIAAEADRPVVSHGLQVGDVSEGRALVWSRADRPSRLIVEWSRQEDFARAVRIRGPHALPVSDLTARVDLTGLPAGEDIFVRVMFQSLDSDRLLSEPVMGRFRTAPRQGRDVTFLWSGDTAGQGWGINPDFGGMRIYETMRRVQPDFFIHSGDNIYADGPMLPSVTLADGSLWRNAHLDVEPAKRKVAETLDEFRGNYRYNRLDENVLRFTAEVPQIWQWDDHEVTNNWSDSKDLSGDARYTEKRVPTLVSRATRAFLEHAPMRWHNQAESERVYRHLPYGPHLDVFVLDMRSYRGPNTFNRQETPGPETVFLGRAQMEWLKRRLESSRATWKVIAADMPLGLLVGDGLDASGRPRFEAVANGDGAALGRELEIADLLRFIKRERVANVVWITADVHYCAAHHYDPARAVFKEFEPFWEFVAGPLHAGTFGPNTLDNTFGPRVVFQQAPPPGQANLPPSAGMQFFGQVDIDHHGGEMTVSLKDLEGRTVFAQRLSPARR
ncbi:MAG TPA: alkaline phosphatase D family protein [Vicinamibacteria bacterium]